MVAGKNIEHLAFEVVIAFCGSIVKAKTDGNHLSIALASQRNRGRARFIDCTLRCGDFHPRSMSIYRIVYKASDLFSI
jgi:hypothetical protein